MVLVSHTTFIKVYCKKKIINKTKENLDMKVYYDAVYN